MTSVEVETREKMKLLLEKFVRRLRYSTEIANAKPEVGHSNADYFYDLLFDLGRHMHLCADFRSLLGDEEKKTLRDTFQPALVQIVGFTSARINSLEADDLNKARKRLSELSFLKNEAFDLYKEVCVGGKVELSSEATKSMQRLNAMFDRLEENISDWSSSDNAFSYDNPIDVPNLNGIPANHFWWPEKYRNSCENKAAK
jgi:hypothetical protein